MKIDYKPSNTTNLNNTNSKNGFSVSYKFVKGDNNTDVDSSLCDNSLMQILLPFDRKILNTDLNKILDFKENIGYDLFNKSDPFFNDACIHYKDEYTILDTTRLYRRQTLFQNLTISCNSISNSNKTCTMKGINRLGFINCECQFDKNLQVSTNFAKDSFNDTVGANIEIAGCFPQFLSGDVLSNIGFIFTIVMVAVNIGYNLANILFLSKSFVKSNLKALIMNDFANQIDRVSLKAPLNSGKGKIKEEVNSESDRSSENHNNINQNNVFFSTHASPDVGKKYNKSVKKVNKIDQENIEPPKPFNLNLSMINNTLENNKNSNKNSNKFGLNLQTISGKNIEINTNGNLKSTSKNKLAAIEDEFMQYKPFSDNFFNNNIDMEHKILNDNDIKENKIAFDNLFSDKLILRDNKPIDKKFIIEDIRDANDPNLNNKNFNFDIAGIFDDEDLGTNMNVKDSEKRFNNYISEKDQLDNKKVLPLNDKQVIDITDEPIENKLPEKINLKPTEFLFRDYTYMTSNDRIVRDDRKKCKYFCDIVRSNHFFLNIFMFKSIINPLFIRLLYLSCSVSLLLLANTLLFFDNYIIERIQVYPSSGSFDYAIKLIMKSGLSLLAAMLGRIIIGFIILVPQQYSTELNDYLITKDEMKIKEGMSKFNKLMKLRYIALGVIFVIITLLTLYYVSVFSNIYKTSSMVMLFGFLISLLLDICLGSFIYPILLTITWSLAKKVKGCFIGINEFVYWFRII